MRGLADPNQPRKKPPLAGRYRLRARCTGKAAKSCSVRQGERQRRAPRAIVGRRHVLHCPIHPRSAKVAPRSYSRAHAHAQRRQIEPTQRISSAITHTRSATPGGGALARRRVPEWALHWPADTERAVPRRRHTQTCAAPFTRSADRPDSTRSEPARVGQFRSGTHTAPVCTGFPGRHEPRVSRA
jgi:hypothetical protein